MTGLVNRTGDIQNETDEHARRAVAAFRRLQPVFSAFARNLTGRPEVRVEMAVQSNGSTDGTRIFIRPPLALGDNVTHQPRLCDRITPEGDAACPACRIRDDILTTVYHEIDHIAFKSFETISEDDKKRTIQFAHREVGGKWAEEVKKRIDSVNPNMLSYRSLAGLVNEYLPYLVNALEDARVDLAMFRERPGTKRMFEANSRRIFEEGFEALDQKTGKVKIVSWREAPLNTQIMVGTLVKVMGYDYSNWFHPKVAKDLGDEKLTEILNRMYEVKRVKEVYALSFHVLACLRELGYLATEKDPNPEPEESDESEESDAAPEQSDESSDEGAGGLSDSDAVPEESESERTDDESDGAGDSEPEGSSDSGADSEDESSGSESEESDSSHAGDDDESPESSSNTDEESVPGNAEPSDDLSDDSDSGEGSSIRLRDEDDYSDDSESSGEPAEADSEDSDSSEVIDTGADDGYGGTMIEDNGEPLPDYGTPEEVEMPILKWSDHVDKPSSVESPREETAIDTAIIQGIYFTHPSSRIGGVEEHYYGKSSARSGAWSAGRNRAQRTSVGQDSETAVPESVLQPALGKTRRAFTDNARGGIHRHRKSGRVDASVLGKRAALDDPRLFMKKSLPGKKDYYVVIGMDLSYSTVGVNLALEKRAVRAQAELLHRAGIPFSIYGHSGSEWQGGTSRTRVCNQLGLDIYHIKDPNEPWNQKIIQRIDALGPASANLDGHAMEYLRKRLDEHRATDKILLYYSDGKMPCENHDEELEILRREIATCRQRNYTLLGVGIRTDSPARHGLETVQVHGDDDLVQVVNQLGKRLSAK